MSWGNKEGEKRERPREGIEGRKERQGRIGVHIYKIVLLETITFGWGLMRLLYQMD